MNGLTGDTIAIDTNVFLQLFLDANENKDGHIDKLLHRLMSDTIALLVDDGGDIADEYQKQITPHLKNEDDTNTRILILRYWMVLGPRISIAVDHKSDLLTAVGRVVVEKKEKVDRTMVAVACLSGRILVTNDYRHILVGPPREKPGKKKNRRSRLLKATKKHSAKGYDFIDSPTAHSNLDD